MRPGPCRIHELATTKPDITAPHPPFPPPRPPPPPRSVFGEDALVNVSVEKTAEGKLAGYIRIRSKTQGIALSLGCAPRGGGGRLGGWVGGQGLNRARTGRGGRVGRAPRAVGLARRALLQVGAAAVPQSLEAPGLKALPLGTRSPPIGSQGQDHLETARRLVSGASRTARMTVSCWAAPRRAPRPWGALAGPAAAASLPHCS